MDNPSRSRQGSDPTPNDEHWQVADMVSSEVRSIINETRRRRLAGERWLDEEVLARHQNLANREELRRALFHLHMVERAFAAAANHSAPSSSSELNFESSDANTTLPPDGSSSRTFRIRCPHCSTHAERIPETPWDEIKCGACGNSFRLASEENVADDRHAGHSIGHFDLMERIGRGGFGTVWKAYDRELDRIVAIKVPRRGNLTPAETEQFFREARAAGQLRHPSIVPIHEVGRDHDTIYIVSDYIGGGSLAEWLLRERMTADEAAAVCEQLADALEHAHESGVIHRDLKPSNILIDEHGRAHVTDFGLARRMAREVTVTLDGQLVGTPAYMSPEQARGESHSADHSSDIYSLGVILFELLTGDVPFRGNAHMIIEQILHDEPPNPRRLNRTVPRDISTICLKCLEKYPSQRYPSAIALAEDLGRYLRREPIRVRSTTQLERTWRWCRRRPDMASLMASLVFVVTIGFAGIFWNWRKAEQARKEAAARADDNTQGLKRLQAASALVDDGVNFTAMLRWDDAASALTKAIALRPDFASARAARAEMYQKLGQWELAESDYEVSFELHEPEGSANWFQHAVTQVFLNHDASYRQLCSRMRNRFGGTANAATLTDLLRTIGLLPHDPTDPHTIYLDWAQDIVKGNPNDSVAVLNLATAHLRAGQFSESVQRCREALNLNSRWPNHASIYSVLAMAYHGMQDDAAARIALDRLEFAYDSDLQQRFILGIENWTGHKGAVGFYHPGEWLEMLVYRRQARSQLGLSVESDGRELALRARALTALRHLNEAIATYNEAVLRSPDNTQIQVELLRTRAFQSVQQRKFAQAASYYHQARLLHPLDSDLWRFEAVGHLGADQVQEYRNVCNELVVQFRDTKDELTAYNTVDTLSMLPSVVSDVEWLEGLARIPTSNRGGSHLQGMAQYRAGHYVQAAASLEKAATHYQPIPVILYFLAMSHYQLGHIDDANRYLSDAQAWIEEAQRDNHKTGRSIDTRVTWNRGGWQEFIQTDYLRREAESLVHRGRRLYTMQTLPGSQRMHYTFTTK